MRARVVLAALALIAGAACSSKSGVRAKLDDAKVAAKYSCGNGPSGHLSCWLDLATTPALQFTVPTCNDRAELAEDEAGKLVGHRCAGEPWRVVRLRGKGRYIEECNVAAGANGKPDWSKLGPVEPKALAMLECAQDAPRAWVEITRAIMEESSPEAAAKLVVSTTLRPSGTQSRAFQGNDDGWVDAFDVLPPPAQAIVRKETCPALQKPASSLLLYSRAARRCPLDATNVADVALEAYKNRVVVPRSEFGGMNERSGANIAPHDLNVAELGFVMEGFIALKGHPKEAAQISCENINGLSRKDDPVRLVVAASILAVTKTICPALQRKGDLWPCDLPTPQKSKIAELVAQFGNPPPGAPPVLAMPNEALFEAISLDGQLPPNYCP